MDTEFNAYPNRGEAYVPSFAKEQDTRSREKEDVETYHELYKQLIDDLDQAIARLSSVDSIDHKFTLNRNKFMNQVRGNQIAKAHLENERNSLQAIINQHFK